MNASAQTPRALAGETLIDWQAGLPQNGPKMRESGWEGERGWGTWEE
jgi:hypothetical protein